MNQKYLVVNDYTTGETHIINGWNDDDGEAIEEYLSDNYSDEIEWMLSKKININ